MWKVDNDMFAAAITAMGEMPGRLSMEGDLILQLTEAGEYFHIKDGFTIINSVDGTSVRHVTTGSLMGSD